MNVHSQVPELYGRYRADPRYFPRYGANVAEDLAVRPAHLFPVVDLRHEHSRPHDIRQSGSHAAERSLDVLQRLNCLGVGIADTQDFTAFVRRGGT